VSAAGLALVLACPLGRMVPVGLGDRVRWMQVGYALAALGWLLVVWQVGRARGAPARASGPRLPAILGVALLVRLLMLATPISDDVYRYVWEGRVRLAGYNPYVVAPDDPRLAYLRTEWWPRINHPNHATIYPPAVQSLFVLLAWCRPDPAFFRLVMLAADVATLGLLVIWLRRRGRDVRAVAVYALCPLVLQAFAGEGHLDALLVFGLAVMLVVLDTPSSAAQGESGVSSPGLGQAVLGGVGMGIALGTKWAGVVLLPWFLVRLTGMREGSAPPSRAGFRQGESPRSALLRSAWALVTGVLAAGLITLAPFAGYMGHGFRAMFDPLRYFFTHFHVLDAARHALLAILPPTTVTLVSAGLASGVALVVAARRVPLPEEMLWSLGALVLLSPTVHPWYFTWLLPALCVRRVAAWFLLIVLLVLAYEGQHVSQQAGAWTQPTWVAAGVFVPFYVLLAGGCAVGIVVRAATHVRGSL